MSHPQPPQRQPTTPETDQYVRTLHNTALIALIACPVLILIPPRKLDAYTFGLCGATVYSANFLIRERTGRSIYQHINRSPEVSTPLGYSSIPPTEQANLRKEVKGAELEMQRLKKDAPSILEEVRNQRDIWKAQRKKEIEEDVEEGKGFGEMIYDQIWEVWNWRKRSDDDDG